MSLLPTSIEADIITRTFLTKKPRHQILGTPEVCLMRSMAALIDHCVCPPRSMPWIVAARYIALPMDKSGYSRNPAPDLCEMPEVGENGGCPRLRDAQFGTKWIVRLRKGKSGVIRKHLLDGQVFNIRDLRIGDVLEFGVDTDTPNQTETSWMLVPDKHFDTIAHVGYDEDWVEVRWRCYFLVLGHSSKHLILAQYPTSGEAIRHRHTAKPRLLFRACTGLAHSVRCWGTRLSASAAD